MITKTKAPIQIESFDVQSTKSGKAAIITLTKSIEEAFGLPIPKDPHFVITLSQVQLDILKSKVLKVKSTGTNMEQELAMLVGICESNAIVLLEPYCAGDTYVNKEGETITRDTDGFNYSVSTIVLPKEATADLKSAASNNVVRSWNDATIKIDFGKFGEGKNGTGNAE